MKIRRVSPIDLEPLIELFELYRAFHGQQPNKVAVRSYLIERLQNKQSVIFIVEYQNLILGFSQLYPTFSTILLEEEWVINDLFVSDKLRGKGAGGALLKAAQNFIRQKNRNLVMEVSEKIQHKLYENEGWNKKTENQIYYWKA